MVGLVSYESSDEEEEVQTHKSAPPTPPQPQNGTTAGDGAPIVGPMLPPAEEPAPDPDLLLPPGSPYTAERTLLRDLTLPAVPDFDLPPSPPGSPPPEMTARVESLLKLKTQDVHFNARLEDMPSMRNPALMDQLMEFAGLEGPAAYATTLPREVYDPAAFPEWAYRSEMKRLEERERKKREEERAATGKVEFVKGSTILPVSGGSGGLSQRKKTTQEEQGC